MFLGPPGVGKTHLSIGLAVKALEVGYRVLFTTLAHLVADLVSAPHPAALKARMRRYLAAQVLIIDEVGSIILTSNTSFAEWGALLGNEVLATALLDRLLHHTEAISIQGRSYRMKIWQITSNPKPEERSKRRKEDGQQQEGVVDRARDLDPASPTGGVNFTLAHMGRVIFT